MPIKNEREGANPELSETGNDLVFVIASNAIEGFHLNNVQIKEIIEELGLVEEGELILNKLTRLKKVQGGQK